MPRVKAVVHPPRVKPVAMAVNQGQPATVVKAVVVAASAAAAPPAAATPDTAASAAAAPPAAADQPEPYERLQLLIAGLRGRRGRGLW